MFSQFYYKRKLRSYRSVRPTARHFLSLKEMKRLVIAMECEDFNDVRKVEKAIKPLIKNIPVVHYVAFLNIDNAEEVSYAAGTHDILLFKDDVVRKLTPKTEAIERIDALKPDVFVNLNKEPSAVIDFLSAISCAKMRVGFEEKKTLSDLMITGLTEHDVKSFFEKLIQIMEQMKIT